MVFLLNDSMTRIKRSLVQPAFKSMLKRFFASLRSSSTFQSANMGPIEKQYRYMEKYDPTKELVSLAAGALAVPIQLGP